jgi:hypothetical protein
MAGGMEAVIVRGSAMWLAVAGAAPLAFAARCSCSLTASVSNHIDSLTLSADNACNPGTSKIAATSAWSLQAPDVLGVYAGFYTSAVALTDVAGDNTRSPAFFISDNGGASTALTQTVPFGRGDAGLQLAGLTTITSATENSSRTDAMTFNVNSDATASGTYRGMLNLRHRRHRQWAMQGSGIRSNEEKSSE